MEQNITLQIDNHIVEVAKGTTILEAARGVGGLCFKCSILKDIVTIMVLK